MAKTKAEDTKDKEPKPKTKKGPSPFARLARMRATGGLDNRDAAISALTDAVLELSGETFDDTAADDDAADPSGGPTT